MVNPSLNSEMYGRLPVYFVTNVGFTAFNLACGLSTNLNMLIGFRFLAGCFGSAPVTIGGGTIADMMPIERRAGAMAIWVGPIIDLPSSSGFDKANPSFLKNNRLWDPCSVLA